MNIKNVVTWIFRALFMWDKYFRYSILARIVNTLYPWMVITEYWKYLHDDKEFFNYYTKFEGKSFNSFDRKFTIREFLKLVEWLSGDTVECGWYKGATSYLILKNIPSSKNHHIFDSWEWLSKPGKEDGHYWWESSLTTSEEIIRENLKSFSNVHFYKGWIPTRFHEMEWKEISFLHIDVDLYEPTRDSLEFFYPRLQSGWIVVCDDYGFTTCPGARKAMDEFALKNNVKILDLTTGQWIIIKP